MPPAPARRYSTVAIVLHWLIAAGVLAMVPMGWWMSDAIVDPANQAGAYRVYQLHKSLGVAILGLTLIRLAWRLAHPAPPLPAAMPAWERATARATHAAFYALLIALPLTGWIYVSSGWSVGYDRPLNVATSFFGLVQVPHLPGLAAAEPEVRRAVAARAMGAHELMAWGAVLLAALHVAAALKHQLADRDATLARMIPWLRGADGDDAVDRAPWPTLAGVGFVMLLAGSAALWSAPGPPSGAVPAPTSAASAAAPAERGEAIAPGRADRWIIDETASRLTFAGTHAGAPFRGRFEDWEAYVWFDPADLAGSKVVIVVRTGSARTGDATQEGSLAEAEWLDPRAFPTARFEATRFEALGGGRYAAVGELRLKGRTTPVRLPFALAIDGDAAEATGQVELDREALDVGMVSDPTADWVSRNVAVSFEVVARRARAPDQN